MNSLRTYWLVVALMVQGAALNSGMDIARAQSTTRTDDGEWSPLRNVPFRSIGPSVMGGRVVDVEVSPHDPTSFYAGYATGGVWKTETNGSAFTPLFEGQATMSIGDIAVRWGKRDVIYVGTGESNASHTVVPGAGIYRSRDEGGKWDYLGLAETESIGKVLLSPVDTNVIFVAALGKLYAKNPERGVFKTTDGGMTWRPVLQIDDSTGVVDLIMHPENHEVLYAAAWHRSRKPWDFVEGGKSSGIYRSNDGGEHWTLLSTKKSGFPTGRRVGRIGLAISASSPSTLFAVVDNQSPIQNTKGLPKLTFDKLQEMSASVFAEKVTEAELDEFLEHYRFPEAYDGDEVHRLIAAGEVRPSDLVDWVGESNRAHYDAEILGCEVYRSNDGGRHWWRTNERRLEDVCKSFGYYFGRITIDPSNVDRVYLSGIPLLKSEDGGASFESIDKANVHIDHHALWVNPDRPGHLVDGNDGGLNLSYDDGDTWFKLNAPAVGQFYTVNFDRADPYNVYGGLQDNGVWFGPSTYEASTKWQSDGSYPYQQLLGGDGMAVEVSRADNNIVFAGKQFGATYRVVKNPRSWTFIRPYHRFGEQPLRFNWRTPIELSVHNDQILYLGSQKVHRSMDHGDSWQVLSGDLTKGSRKGDVPYATLTALEESPLRLGVLYTGSDDGLVHGSRDGGTTWDLLTTGLPEDWWVSGIEPSQHEVSRVYLALNGMRSGHRDAMVFVSEDYGHEWSRLGKGLPQQPVNVVREDPVNQNVLYVGTDNGLYVSLDRGKHFVPTGRGLPAAPLHDLRVLPEARELIVATHGRSLFAADVSVVQELKSAITESSLHVFETDTVWNSRKWGNNEPAWDDPELPEATLAFWSLTSGDVTISIKDQFGRLLTTFERESERGLNYVPLDFCIGLSTLRQHMHARAENGDRIDPDWSKRRDNGNWYLPSGTFHVHIASSAEVATTSLIVAD